MKFKIKIVAPLVVIIIVSVLKQSYSQEIILSTKSSFPKNITSFIELFNDSTSQIPFGQIALKQFIKNKKSYFLFPYSNNAYWIKFIVKNEALANKKWLLKWDNHLTEELDCYVSDSLGNNFSHTKKKLLTTQKVKKFLEEEITFNFDLPANTTKTIYLKLKSQRGLYGSIVIHSATSYTDFRLDSIVSSSFNNGLILFRLFLVVILGLFVIKDFLFRMYSLQITIRTLTFLGMMNVIGPIVSPNPDIAKVINFLCYNSMPIGSGILVLSVLDQKKLPKWMPFTVYASIIFTFLINILVCIDYKWYWMKAGHYGIIFSAILVLSIYVYCIIKKKRIQIYYSIPFILGIMSNLLINLRLLGLLEFKPIFTISIFLFLAEIFFFVVFLGQIFKNIERNKFDAEQKLQLNLVQNERIRELNNLKSEFFTNISHEFRTPLTLILSPIEDLRKKYPNERLLEPMKRNAQRLLSLINQLLDLSKLDAGQMRVSVQQSDLAKYIQTLVNTFGSLADSRKIDFSIEQNRDQAIAYFDADKMEKILVNLLLNAFKFTKDGGKISVLVNYEDTFEAVEIVVKDNGIGISAQNVSQIFDRFYQIDGSHQRNYEGSGIGLALVKEMVNLHKGHISVESTEGQGTAFFVKLPINKSTWANETMIGSSVGTPTMATMIGSSVGTPTTAGGASVGTPTTVVTPNENVLLIVEDNADLREYIRDIFEQDYQIIEAIDGQEGIGKAMECIPDIVICDLMMPRLDGFGFCKLLKNNEKTDHIPVIMLTAKANVESRMEGFELGADDYLTKPFNREEILVRVKNLVAQRNLLRQKFDKRIVDLKPSEVKVSSLEEKFIAKTKVIIEKHLSESAFDVEQFANEMGMTSTVLRRKLKAISNQTVTEFVRNYRLQRAADLLTKRTGSVSEIAYEVGFESLSYFTKVFQEAFGKLPSEFPSLK